MKKVIFLVALCIGTIASAQQLSMDLTKALKNDDTNAISTLVTDDNKNTCYEVGRTSSSVAHLAVQMGSADVLEFLIQEKKVDLNNTCGGLTPLMQAVKYSQPNLVAILVKAGADTTIKVDGKTAADYITEGDRAAKIKKLLD
ncbi:ankyrin repeat domain-containing protein [Nonlabens sp.]|uniref:ankyrin repeat domain-containing protein n=1 Tax=Nonlabens sp. TaxID=1888209 RepID=UPI003F69808B